MAEHRVRVGLHGRNDVRYPDPDYELVRRARIETLKTMSFTEPDVYRRLRQEQPDLEFIVRLYDDRIGRNSHPTSAEFVARMVPFIQRLKPYAFKFEIHNEPNHFDGIEGWGPSDEDACSFRAWYLRVIAGLRRACPWAKFGFPGLALNYPHRDLPWLDICRDAVEASDWLGCHCYWQYGNMLSDAWGLRFKRYHERFPKKKIEVTEFGDSTPNRSCEEIAQLYVRYYQELSYYAYVGSASSFIGSSPDSAWWPFVWRKESGELLPVVDAVGNMERKPVEVTPPRVPAPAPAPKSAPGPTLAPLSTPIAALSTPTQDAGEPGTERTFPETGKTVRNEFLEFFNAYGLDVCGYPITDEFEENGHRAQIFERVGLELLQDGQIRLKPAASEAWDARSRIADLEARVEELSKQPMAPAPPSPSLQDVTAKLMVHPTSRYPTRALSDVRLIVIHHTATSPTVTPQRLAEHAVRTLDYPGIGFHFVVAADGTIYQTNRLETVSRHAFSHNQESVGVCFPGNFTSEIPTAAQLEAGGRLCAWLLVALRLSPCKILGLGELVNTQSPGKQWLTGKCWKEKLLAEVDKALQAETGDAAAVIAALREQIQTLQDEIEKLKAEQAVPVPATPEPRAPAKIARPAIQDMTARLARHPTETYETRNRSDIRNVVIHHSAVVPSVGPQAIARYHVTSLDWPGAGYHFFVAADGIIYQAHALEAISYHAAHANPISVGICFLGSFMETVPPAAQLRAGARLVAWLLQELDLGIDDVKGHQEVGSTACPGDQWLQGRRWKAMLRQEVARVQEAAEAGPAATPGSKRFYHYLLFSSPDGADAEQDWINARNYVGRFQPAAGFSPDDASCAEYVTVVGGTPEASSQLEEMLRAAGCKVERIAGQGPADTLRQFDELVRQGKRFRTLAE